MTDNEKNLRDALSRIAEVAAAAVQCVSDSEEPDDPEGAETQAVCTPKSLPKNLLVKAAATACQINPVNAPVIGRLPDDTQNLVLDPLHLAVLTSKYWGPTPRRLTVSFMETTPADLRARIVAHLNAWTRTGCIEFVQTSRNGQIRISRGRGGYWSYLGTDVLHIAANRPTMNLEGFTMNTSEAEFRRVVRHEAGHTLGFPHEHMRRALVARIDRRKAYEYFRRTQGWDEATVNAQVLTPLDERTIMFTPADETSIMCYQLPGEITRDGRPILGGRDINQTDYDFVGRIYPRAGRNLLTADDGIDGVNGEWIEDPELEAV